MLLTRKNLRALAGATAMALPAAAGAGDLGRVETMQVQAQPSGRPLPPGTTLTGKERLGGKASDEQRLDNCKVAPDKRGSKPRPDSCEHEKVSLLRQH